MNEKLPARIKWLYGSGDLGFSLIYTILSVYFALFLTDVVGVKPYIAAIAIFVGGTWDYVNDPIAGYISDHTRSRWGTETPFFALRGIAVRGRVHAVVVETAARKPGCSGNVLCAGFCLIRYSCDLRLHAVLCVDTGIDRRLR